MSTGAARLILLGACCAVAQGGWFGGSKPKTAGNTEQKVGGLGHLGRQRALGVTSFVLSLQVECKHATAKETE